MYQQYYAMSPYAEEPLLPAEWNNQATDRRAQKPVERTESEGRPLVTIVIVYDGNTAKIERCIQSVLQQTQCSFEILYVVPSKKGGSFAGLEHPDRRVRVLPASHNGYGQMVIHAMRHATGVYLALFSSTGYALPNMLQRLTELAQKEALDVIQCAQLLLEDTGEGNEQARIYDGAPLTANVRPGRIEDPNDAECLITSLKSSHATLYRLSFLRANAIILNESEGRNCQEQVLWAQTMCQARRYLYIDEPLYCREKSSRESLVGENPDAICDECDYVRHSVRKSPTLERRFAQRLAVFRIRTCLCAVEFVDEPHKESLYQRIAADIRSLRERGELNDGLLTLDELHEVEALLKDPSDYYYANARMSYEFCRYLPPSRYPQILARDYKERTSKELNLSDPRTFNEIVQWLKLFGQSSRLVALTNRKLVRERIETTGGDEFLAPILASWEDPKDICFEGLPKSFLVRAGSWRQQVEEAIDWDHSDCRRLEEWATEWLCANSAVRSSLELAYADATPSVTIEPLTHSGNVDSTRYAVDCFGGKATLVWVYDGLDEDSSYARLYTPDWQFLYRHNHVSELYADRKPKKLGDMLALSEMLSEGIAVCSIIFRLLDGKVVFDEVDPYPNSGLQLWSEYLDIRYGRKIELPTPSPLPNKSFAERGVGPTVKNVTVVSRMLV